MTSIAFRVDSSRMIGTGHVMRCLTLAAALRAKGATSLFICREHDGNLIELIERTGFATARLPLLPGGGEWLGATPEEDAREVLAVLGGSDMPDWLIADHYEIGADWERMVRPGVGRLMVIDDLADRAHDCDLLLDQNLVADFENRYAGKLPERCKTLLGPEYALLQQQYSELHSRAVPRKGIIRRVLIFFGGADAENLTGAALRAVLASGRSDLAVDVVAAESSLHLDELRAASRSNPNVSLHTSLPSLAPLMMDADLAIGASGATSWERLCLGLPALVVTLADNQLPIAAELDRRGLIRLLGKSGAVDESTFSDALAPLLETGLDEEWSARCLESVDGGGADRVVAKMGTNEAVALRARRAAVSDEAILLEWANDPGTRRNAFTAAAISPETHRAWFASRMGDTGCRFYIVEKPDGAPVGQVRFQRHETDWEIHYSLAPEFRGRGFGRRLLQTAIAEHRAADGAGSIFGQVKSDNEPSIRVFESLGFKMDEGGSEVLVYRSAPALPSSND